MMRILNFRPRYEATVWVARFGSRDEICGWDCMHVCHAETRGWLDRLVSQYVGPDDDDWYDIDVRVTDNQPEREPERWGPKLPWWKDESGDDLPF